MNFYGFTMQTLYTVCFFSSILMFLIPSEKRKQLNVYTRSRYMVGVIFLVFGALCLFNYKFGIKHMIYQPYVSVVNLAAFYLAGILFGFSMIPLLNKEYFNWKNIIWCSVRYFIFLGIASLAFFLEKPFSSFVVVVAVVYFFADSVYVSARLLKNYRKCVKDINNYYSEYNVEPYVHWMYKVTILIIVYGLSYAFVVATNRDWITVFSIVGIGMITYITISYNNYMMYVEKIDESQEGSATEADELVIDPLTYAGIEKHLQGWIDNKKYLGGKITIASLSSELNTNRTYLSYYINNLYGCSFRDFISVLRIEVAKELLANDMSKDIDEIAEITGFSSTSNFYRTFKKLEKSTPANYRSYNKV